VNKKVGILLWISCAIFLVLAAQGYIAVLLSLGEGLLKTNMIEILVHLTIAIGFAVVTKLSINTSIWFIRVIGIFCILISLIGFMEMNVHINDQLIDIIYFNTTSYMHFGIGIILSYLGSNLMNHQFRTAT
jgi:hypothetical protein